VEEILEVLEGSLVYRGADRETSIVGEHGDLGMAGRGDDFRRMLLFEVGPISEKRK